jgi:hypothetical protein
MRSFRTIWYRTRKRVRERVRVRVRVRGRPVVAVDRVVVAVAVLPPHGRRHHGTTVKNRLPLGLRLTGKRGNGVDRVEAVARAGATVAAVTVSSIARW